MKRLLLVLFLSQVFIFASKAAEKAQVDSFLAKIEAAYKAKDIKAVEKLYYFEGVSDYAIDTTMSLVEFQFTSHPPKPDLVFTSAEFIDKADLPAHKDLFPAQVESLSKPTVMNGHLYVPSAEFAGIVRIQFSCGPINRSVQVRHVGVAPDGTLRLTLLRRK